MAVLARYLDYDIPPAGCGNSAHGRILGKADLGIIAGLTPDEIFADIRANIPPGKRRVSDKEIWDAIHKAFSDHTDGCFVPVPKPKPIVNDSRAVLSKLIEQGRGASEESIREASPIPIDSECMTISILQSLSHGEDPLFIGEREQPGIVGETIRTAREWIEDLSKGARPGPHIIPNPLSGVPAPKKSGDGETFRGDGNVATFRFCVAEFDNLSREDQLSFWAAVDLPIVALIDSAGKVFTRGCLSPSLHTFKRPRSGIVISEAGCMLKSLSPWAVTVHVLTRLAYQDYQGISERKKAVCSAFSFYPQAVGGFSNGRYQ